MAREQTSSVPRAFWIPQSVSEHYHVAGASTHYRRRPRSGMEYATRPLSELFTDIASPSVAPAGGTAGAVVAATGTALCEMACIHLRAADAPTDVDLVELEAELEGHRKRLLTLGSADAAVVEALFGSDGEAGHSARKRSVGVPLALAESCLAALEAAAAAVTGASDRPVVADAVTGAYFLEAALRSAVATAQGNLASVDEQSFRAATERRLSELETSADRLFRDVTESADAGAQ